MKSVSLLFSLFLCALTASCTSHLSQLSDPKEVRLVGSDPAVSDAWLDTAPRTPQRPHRPADGITHWKTGPSIDRISGVSPQPSPVKSTPKVVEAPRQREEPRHVTSGYSTHYGGSYHGRRHPRTSNQPFVRTVETVGPPIVPRLDVPTTVRTAPRARTNSYTTNRYSGSRKETHRSGSNRDTRTRANDGKGRGMRSGRGR